MARNTDWRNSAIDMDDFGGSRLSLKADTIKPATATVITVSDVEKITLQDTEAEGGRRNAIVLQSEEYPDRGFWLNKSGMRTMMEKLGNKPSDWIGQRVPLVVVRTDNPRTNATMQALQVAMLAEWDDVMDQFDGKPARRRSTTPATKTAAKKKTAKKSRGR